MKFKIYYHESCPTSLKLLRLLKGRKLLEKVETIDVGQRPLKAISKGLVLVPAVLKGDELIDFGSVNMEKCASIIAGESFKEDLKKIGIEDAVNYLIHDILDNLFLSLVIYLRGNILPILDYTLSILKLNKLYGKEIIPFLTEYLEENGKQIYESIKEKLKKIIAINFMREINWIHGRVIRKEEFEKMYPFHVFAHWVLARSSISRVGLLTNLTTDRELTERIKELREHLLLRWDEYSEKYFIGRKKT